MEKESEKEKGKGKEERQDGKEGRERGGVEKVVEKDVGLSEEKQTSASADRTDQVFVKMDGCKTLPVEVSPNDKVGDILRRIQSSEQTGPVRDMRRKSAEER